MVTFHYMAQLRRAAGTSEESLNLDRPRSILELLRERTEVHGPEFRRLLFDPNGEILASVLIFVGQSQIVPQGDCLIKPGDEVTILTPIAGG